MINMGENTDCNGVFGGSVRSSVVWGEQSQIDKFKKKAEDAVNRMSALDSELVAAKKEIEALQRAAKKDAAATNAREMRINRLTEELEKAKVQLREVPSSHSLVARRLSIGRTAVDR